MTQALLCMSHSPLLDHATPPAEVKSAVDDAFARARDFVEAFDPELVVNFGPDHFNGFFYDLMPPFCIGYRLMGPATTTRSPAISTSPKTSRPTSRSSSSTTAATSPSRGTWK